MLRAVDHARAALSEYPFETGDREDDARTRALVRQLVSEGAALPAGASASCAAATAAKAAFDESALFAAPEDARMSPLERALARESVEELRAQFFVRFRNISTIMDCVTCERCRLWGTLQVLGLGTALKILFMEGDLSGVGALQRNEVVALVNLLAQLAKSVDSIRDWQRRDLRRALAKLALAALASLFALLAALAHLLRTRRRRVARL